jgi:feruloyl esterase
MRSAALTFALVAAALAAGCGGGGDGVPLTVTDPAAPPPDVPAEPARPQLAAATPASFTGSCESLLAQMGTLGAQTTITLAATVPAGLVSGIATAEHCRIVGRMNQRVSPVDGNTYSIGFEVRAPKEWNGRFFYQANGGTDGSIGTASGGIGGGSPTSTALSKGFAVLSSDAGHTGGGPFFGLDPQARLDYGYMAIAHLTPMAKDLLKVVYGKAPDRSYLGGCSNGGRHAFVAAARYADQYDGILAGNAGFNLPASAVAQLWGAQQFAAVATATLTANVPAPGGGTTSRVFPDITTAFTPAEMELVSTAVLGRCDALDGLQDGLVGDVAACQSAFSLHRDVPLCSGARDGTCLSFAQKSVLANIFAGVRNAAGQPLYASWPFDAGLSGSGWRQWKFTNSVTLSPGATAFIFTVPPETNTTTFSGRAYAMDFDVNVDAPKIYATNSLYTEAAMSFMTPPPSDLSVLKNRGAKMMIYHGVSDPTFSFNDTVAWYEKLRQAHGGSADDFARLYAVPGMNHCSGGPATDRFDMLDPLVAWVEEGTPPDAVLASARSNNAELPPSWSTSRTRPLCPWPKVARYKGSGDVESADSFNCQ